MTKALSPETFVTAIYQSCLGRDPEPEGVTYWADLIRRHDDPTLVLAGIMESAEYRGRIAAGAGAKERSTALATEAARLLGRRPRVVDVGAQFLGEGSHPYDPLKRYTPVEVLGFDPLEDRLAERAAAEQPDGLTLLPYAIGDGGHHTLHVNNDDATSSLFPLNEAHNACFNHLSELRTVRTETVPTRRLDEVLPQNTVDFLKLDIQGAELMVLRSAPATLARTAVVHCEVEFSPIYRGQPLFPEVQAHLNAQGFDLIDLLVPGRYHYLAPGGEPAQDRLLWADAVFFRRAEAPEVLRAQALCAAAIYGKPSLAAFLLDRAAGPSPAGSAARAPDAPA